MILVAGLFSLLLLLPAGPPQDPQDAAPSGRPADREIPLDDLRI
jgi:hypothetical protein